MFLSPVTATNMGKNRDISEFASGTIMTNVKKRVAGTSDHTVLVATLTDVSVRFSYVNNGANFRRSPHFTKKVTSKKNAELWNINLVYHRQFAGPTTVTVLLSP